MLSAFWDSVGSSLADRWAAVGGPALVFWVGAVLAWTFAGGGWDRLSEVAVCLDRQSTTVQIAALLGAVLVVIASGVVVGRLTTPMLRWLEGYGWPKLAADARKKRVAGIQKKAADEQEDWQELYGAREEQGSLSADDNADFVRLEMDRHRRPSDPQRLMPTRIGNILRASEARPGVRYGLDSVVVWPRLWLVMPESGRQELAAARGSLDSGAAAVVWGLGFACLVPLSLLLPAVLSGLSWLVVFVSVGAAVLGMVVSVSAIKWWVPARAEVFGDLVETCYDLYRGLLYEQLRWPLPEDPLREKESGRQLTSYLWRGSDNSYPRFTNPA